MREWREASYENRLATSGDLVARVIKEQPSSMDELRVLAVRLEQNISAANPNGEADSQKVAEVAAACWLLMQNGY
jgi:hypothetical protein